MFDVGLYMVPEQCRAARALLAWSQDDLEKASGVAKRTIADFERGATIPYDRTLRELQGTLEANGIQFIPENGGGAGVRLRGSVPRLKRRKVFKFQQEAKFVISYRSSEYKVILPTSVLDDLDRTHYGDDRQYEGAFDAHLSEILSSAASVIDSGRVSAGNEIFLEWSDFPR